MFEKHLTPCTTSSKSTPSENSNSCTDARDEKYKAETIEIIRQLMDDAKLSGNSQVCMCNYDQLCGLTIQYYRLSLVIS